MSQVHVGLHAFSMFHYSIPWVVGSHNDEPVYLNYVWLWLSQTTSFEQRIDAELDARESMLLFFSTKHLEKTTLFNYGVPYVN